MDTAAKRRQPPIRYQQVDVGGVRIFYREAGTRGRPAVLLLHGFPTSSHMFRELMPALADRFHLIAPDYPGFGHSDFPPPSRFRYTFENYAKLAERFVDAIGVERYALFVQDYGAPIGFRLALLRPERVTALIVQNGNAYEEGLSDAWDPLKRHWRHPTPESREALRGWLTADGIRQQYVAGLTPDQAARVGPDTWTLDWALLGRAGNIDVQLDLFADYASNVARYPDFQRFFRDYAPPTLIVWGERDPFFTIRGATAYLRDLPDAQLHLLDAGHFALETNGPEVAALMRDFLMRTLGSGVAEAAATV